MKKIFSKEGQIMPFCSKCGAEILSNELFCANCGAETGYSEPVIPQMTKEESIAFADKLIAEYKKLEKITQEIEENEHQMNRPVESYPKQHAAFKYFWPFLIYAAVSFTVFYFLAGVLGRNSMGTTMFLLLLALGSIPAFLIIGGVRARRIRDELNAAEISFLNNKKEHLLELKKETSILQTKKRTMQKEIKEYEAMLPASLRSSSQISRAKILIQSGKAEDFADAVEKMGR